MIGDVIAGLVIEPIAEWVCYGTGKLIVRVMSLGKLHVDDAAREDRNGKKKRSRGAWTFVKGGRRYLLPEGAKLVGLAFWVAVVFVVAMAARGE